MKARAIDLPRVYQVLLRATLSAAISAVAAVNLVAGHYFAPGLAFALVVVGPYCGFQPAVIAGVTLAWFANFHAMDLLEKVWLGPHWIGLVGSVGVALTLALAGRMGRKQAVRLAVLGTLLGMLFVPSTRWLPNGPKSFWPGESNWLLAFFLWQFPMALYIDRHIQRPKGLA